MTEPEIGVTSQIVETVKHVLQTRNGWSLSDTTRADIESKVAKILRGERGRLTAIATAAERLVEAVQGIDPARWASPDVVDAIDRLASAVNRRPGARPTEADEADDLERPAFTASEVWVMLAPALRLAEHLQDAWWVQAARDLEELRHAANTINEAYDQGKGFA